MHSIFMIMIGALFFHVNLRNSAKAYKNKDHTELFVNIGWAVLWLLVTVIQILLLVLSKSVKINLNLH